MPPLGPVSLPFNSVPNPDRSNQSFTKQTPSKQTPSQSSVKSNEPMSQEEEYIYESFEKYIDVYKTEVTDENKQKAFNNKVDSLYLKLKNHEIKPYLIRLLTDFIKRKQNSKISVRFRSSVIRPEEASVENSSKWLGSKQVMDALHREFSCPKAEKALNF